MFISYGYDCQLLFMFSPLRPCKLEFPLPHCQIIINAFVIVIVIIIVTKFVYTLTTDVLCAGVSSFSSSIQHNLQHRQPHSCHFLHSSAPNHFLHTITLRHPDGKLDRLKSNDGVRKVQAEVDKIHLPKKGSNYWLLSFSGVVHA